MRLAFSVFVTYKAVEFGGWHGKFERLELWTLALEGKVRCTEVSSLDMAIVSMLIKGDMNVLRKYS